MLLIKSYIIYLLYTLHCKQQGALLSIKQLTLVRTSVLVKQTEIKVIFSKVVLSLLKKGLAISITVCLKGKRTVTRLVNLTGR